MSTYLKSATMSLLSKTLQAFLTKYLSDVHVEGVTLPSYDGSGWGVRLSNVELREGVQLMKQIPGRVVKKRKVRRRRRKKPKPEDTSRLDNSEESFHTTNSRKEKNYTKEGTESLTHTSETQDVTADTVPETNLFNAELRGSDKFNSNGEKIASPRRGRTNSAISTADLEVEVTTSADYYTDEDIECDSHDDARPPTPEQSKSMFACFYNSRNGGRNNINDNSLHKEQQSNGGTEATISGESSSKDTGKTSSMTDNSIDHLGEDEDLYEYYEEEEDCELPLRLCLGEHGRIGIVDVRLIGKELHVMVEDAMITIEAIPILTKDDNFETDGTHKTVNEVPGRDNQYTTNGDGTAKESGKITKEDDGGSTDSATAGAKNSTKNTKPEPKRHTVGDRVLADNGLAKMISSIPHLFLRDVCIQLIIRDEPITTTAEKDTSSTATDNSSSHGYAKAQPSTKDTMVEFGIDFLSVTSGEDILSNFQQAHTTGEEGLQDLNNDNDIDSSRRSGTSFADSVSSKPPTLLKTPSNVVDANGEHKNEYLVRHIRTGRGPSGGISIQLFVPNSGVSRIVTKSTASSGDIWACQHWISYTKNHLLRCSGLDIQARIHMGTKRVDAGYSWFYGEYVEDDDEGSEIDSLILFDGSMATVGPGPQLPLPPPIPPIDIRQSLTPPNEHRMSRGNTPGRSSFENTLEDELASGTLSSIHPGVDVNHIDAHGIQSCKVPSSFHRVSRGMLLKSCKDCMQLPSDVSDLCWEVPLKSNVKEESSLDSSIPMPGLTLQISIRDPLEINVDRRNIESIGLIKSLFTNPASPKPADDNHPKKEIETGHSASETVALQSGDATQTSTTSTGFFSSLLYAKPEETIYEEEMPEDSFESFMQPESISVMGIYLADTNIRVQVMQEGEGDCRNLTFCYWQITTKCLTIDRQTLVSPEKSFSDLKLDVGRLVWDEYQGTSIKSLVSLGLQHLDDNRKRCDSSSSISSMIDDHTENRAPWPSTACALLDIRPPIESLPYKSREGHGLQLRLVSVPSSNESDVDLVSRSNLYVRLGLTTIDSKWAIKNEVSVTIREIMKILFGPKEALSRTTDNIPEHGDEKNGTNDATESKEENQESESPQARSLMTYTIQIDSGNISLPPCIEVKMPMTRFSGERSSLAGFSIESLLGNIDFAYGAREPKTQRHPPLLLHIAGLPESVRLHILLCLKDLSPLEVALNVKKEKNPFRRIKSVDKAILKTAKKITKKASNTTSKKKSSNGHFSSFPSPRGSLMDSANRRQKILTEIMKLDDTELTKLWSVHQRYQKKLAKRLREGQDG